MTPCQHRASTPPNPGDCSHASPLCRKHPQSKPPSPLSAGFSPTSITLGNESAHRPTMTDDSEPTKLPETKDGAPEQSRPDQEDAENADEYHDTLKYHLLGPSLTKAGQDAVDQTKVRLLPFLRSAQPRLTGDRSPRLSTTPPRAPSSSSTKKPATRSSRKRLSASSSARPSWASTRSRGRRATRTRCWWSWRRGGTCRSVLYMSTAMLFLRRLRSWIGLS